MYDFINEGRKVKRDKTKIIQHKTTGGKAEILLIVQVFRISSKPFFQENSILCFHLLNTRMLHMVRKKFGLHKYS